MTPLAVVATHTVIPMDTFARLGENDFITDSGSQVSMPKYECLVDLLDSPSRFQGINVAPTTPNTKAQ